ncbi:MAG: DUF4157 domain-containing protein [Ardenticatenaceae bacterium]|nr:DUF4157 domain-containing protein [Ardenticatenaceae bacterium]
MWPVNLLRDGWVRNGRLRQTIWSGAVALGQLVRGDGRGQPGRLGWGLHTFLAQLFDVVGGPEIGQFLMHLITHTTPLTAEEQAMMRAVLGEEAMRYGEVRVAEGGLMDWVFARNGNLAFTTWRTVNFPRNGRHTRANRAILVHELTHVYQYEKVGSRYLGEAIYMLIKTKRDCYAYGGAAGLQQDWQAGKRYKDYNREQQAQIVQDYFSRCERGEDVRAYEPFMVEVRVGEI